MEQQKTRKEMMDECETLEDYQRLAEKLGYKPNWANHVWAARQAKEAQQ